MPAGSGQRAAGSRKGEWRVGDGVMVDRSNQLVNWGKTEGGGGEVAIGWLVDSSISQWVNSERQRGETDGIGRFERGRLRD